MKRTLIHAEKQKINLSLNYFENEIMHESEFIICKKMLCSCIHRCQFFHAKLHKIEFFSSSSENEIMHVN